MNSLFNNIKRSLVLMIAISTMYFLPICAYALEDEVSDREIMEETPTLESMDNTSLSYINDIEVLGANIIKPDFILSKISLKKGDLYDKDIMQSDLNYLQAWLFYRKNEGYSCKK